MKPDKHKMETRPQKLTDSAAAHIVAERLRALENLKTELVGKKFAFRIYRIRKFLFDHAKLSSDEHVEFRTTDVWWALETGEVVAFVESGQVEFYMSLLAEAVNALDILILRNLSLTSLPLQIRTNITQRFAALIYTFHVLIHPFNNGNKRTSHGLAWSYMVTLDPEQSGHYDRELTIEITNATKYTNQEDKSKSILSDVLSYVLAAENMDCWINYIATGHFIHTQQSDNRFPHLTTVQESLDGVLAQIRRNLVLSKNRSEEA